MPIYEYQCNACGHRLEAMQRFSDAPLTDCPECGAAQLRKLVSAAAFQLKGTGWYVTDFRDNGKGKDKGKDKDTVKDASGGGAGGPSDEGSGKAATDKSAASGGSDGATSKEKPAKTTDSAAAAK